MFLRSKTRCCREWEPTILTGAAVQLAMLKGKNPGRVILGLRCLRASAFFRYLLHDGFQLIATMVVVLFDGDSSVNAGVDV